MPARVIEIFAPAGYADSLAAVAQHYEALDFRVGPEAPDGTQCSRMLIAVEQQQEVIDRIQASLGRDAAWRIAILPVEAVIPEPERSEKWNRFAMTTSREALYAEVARGTALDTTFLWLVFLSTVVAAIGLFQDNVAVVIGAMLIAPLLGPNVALAFASALGDRDLTSRALASSGAGLGLSIGGAALAGVVLPDTYSSAELLARTHVGFDSVALALAAGAAGALSFTTRLSSTLVGVMVAVALLPPAATLGYMLGTGQLELALGAAELLVVNIACVNLSAQVIFLAQGIKPRTWFEQRAARQSTLISLATWGGLLIVLVGVIALNRH
jgi:uncharacterized hydrophobic protein (TIGR00341 family)